ncbi:hypothetical protein B0J14DRAFT_581707 [Halenospora varia]|nr:hypothetical protein B0J14DRAFT_581707 [Halenospora varia]
MAASLATSKILTVPFLHKDQLNHDLDEQGTGLKPYLPGNPRIKLNDKFGLSSFIREEFDLKDLGSIAPRLWLMSKQDSTSISPLHRQAVKGRKIVITEDIRLHLVWYHDRVFIKPLPSYLTSHTFWSRFLISKTPHSTTLLPADKEEVCKTALGYLRTFTHLIKHESDYSIARQQHLIPSHATWEALSSFLHPLTTIPDASVSERFHYGEIRLSRLNFYSKLLLRKFYFQRIHAQYASYFATFYAPLLYTFGTLSLLLSAMQVCMSVEQVIGGRQWVRLWDVCRGFSITCLAVGFAISLWLACLFSYKFIKEWFYAIGQRRARRLKVREMV